MEERRIVLLGKTGAGKSATGNTILGTNAFQSRYSIDSVTQTCEEKQAEVNEKLIHVVDTPGFFETKMKKEKLAEEIGRSVYLSQGGVDAFILVFQYGRFTEQEEEIIMKIRKIFGRKVTNNMILLFTHGDEVVNDEIRGTSNKHLKACVEMCGGRYLIFNNTGLTNREQVTRLLGMMEEMIVRNSGQRYTSEVYKAARRYTWKQFWERFKKLFLKAAAVLKTKAKLRQGARRAQEFSEEVEGLLSSGISRMDENRDHLL